jgi:hypothetical protein
VTLGHVARSLFTSVSLPRSLRVRLAKFSFRDTHTKCRGVSFVTNIYMLLTERNPTLLRLVLVSHATKEIKIFQVTAVLDSVTAKFSESFFRSKK